MRPQRHGRAYYAFYSTLLVLALWTATAFASSVNVTVDDTYGDTNTGGFITYAPASSWNVGQTCKACTADPDPNGAWDSSWHDATFYPANSTIGNNKGSLISANYTFTGSAVFVYCITTTSSSSPDGNTDMTFFVDGESVGEYEQVPTGADVYSYAVLVYSNDSLTQGQHEIRIVSGYNDTKALFILDRIMYTTDSDDVTTTIAPATTTGLPTTLTTPTESLGGTQSTSTSRSSSSSHSGTIAGAVVGSLAGVALITSSILFFFWRRKRKVQKAEAEAEKAVQPFLTDGGAFGPPTGESRSTEASSGFGRPLRSRFSPDSPQGDGGLNYPAWAHRFPGRYRTREPKHSHREMRQSHEEISSWERDLHALATDMPTLNAPAPPYSSHSISKGNRLQIATSPLDQSSHSNRTTSQKLPTSPLYSPVPGLSPEVTTSSHVLPGTTCPIKERRSNGRRFNFPTLRIANISSPHSTSAPSPFPTNLQPSTQRRSPSARDPAREGLGTYAGTCVLGPSHTEAPNNPHIRPELGMLAENMSVSGSTVVEGGKNSVTREAHQNRDRWGKGADMHSSTLPNNGVARYKGVQSDHLRGMSMTRPSMDEEGSTMVNASGSTPRMHARPLPHTNTSSTRVEKERPVLPTQNRDPPVSLGHRPLPARPLPKPRGQPSVPSLGMLPFEKRDGPSS